MASWVDMELSDEEKLDALMPMPMSRPDYPCGLCLSFNSQTIDKLGLEELPQVGDLLDMRAFMKVTHVSDGPGGRCFEAQITMILSPVENENTEPEMQPSGGANKTRRGALYARGENWDQDLV